MLCTDVFKNITKKWFLSEPLLFSTYCTHQLVENKFLQVPFRTGSMRIEYSPEIIAEFSEELIEAYLKVEIYRILLLHPYARQPFNSKKFILLLASDITVFNFYKPDFTKNENFILLGVEYAKSIDESYKRSLENPKEINTYKDMSFEDWYKKLYEYIKNKKGGQNAGLNDFIENAESLSELWEENQEAQNTITDQIQKAEIDNGWGSSGGTLQRSLLEQCDFSFDYRKALTQFRQSIISSRRTLTRMRPSRRFGFKAMGSRYERKANILIAVDVSGSISDESFNHFYKAIKNIFFLGIIEKIDVIFFDTNLKYSKPITINQKVQLKEITGRGGTNFQIPVDFYFEHKSEYNGLIIFTDGQGNIPAVSGSSNILWILSSRIDFEKSRQWINTLPGNKSTYLPF